MKRVLLIGAGDYAEIAHLPAIQRVPEIMLAGVVELESRMERVRKLQARGLVPQEIRCHPVPDSCNGRGDLGPTNTAAAVGSLDPTLLREVDAVIVSTYGCHYEYVQWALNNEKHVLVDKPLTNIPGMVVNPADARRLIEHFDILTDLASKKNLLFSLATQRRYSSTYIQMAKELKAAWDGLSDRSVNSIRSIQAFTSDGWFLPSRNYSWGTSGGKVKNTGYHLIDIVTWLLRQVANGIEDAVIQVSPLCVDHLAKSGGRTASNPPPDEPSELYASAQITFREGEEKRSSCVFQFHAQHENFAVTRLTGREFGGTKPSDDFSQAHKNRTKEEALRISLGPYFRVYFRRVAKVLGRAGSNPGEDSNAYLEYSRSYQGAPWPQPFAFQTFPYEDPDSAPAEEFLRALRKPDPASVPTRSPVKDHAVAVRLFSGIYEGIAQARKGNFDPIVMPLREWWTTPPEPKTPPTPQPSAAPPLVVPEMAEWLAALGRLAELRQDWDDSGRGTDPDGALRILRNLNSMAEKIAQQSIVRTEMIDEIGEWMKFHTGLGDENHEQEHVRYKAMDVLDKLARDTESKLRVGLLGLQNYPEDGIITAWAANELAESHRAEAVKPLREALARWVDFMKGINQHGGEIVDRKSHPVYAALTTSLAKLEPIARDVQS